MKMFFSFLPAALLAIAFLPCEGRVRRQIWPAPANPDFFWKGNGNFYDDDEGDIWPGPERFDPPSRFDQPSRQFEQPSRNPASFRDDFNSGGNDRNQNRRTTTENWGPITSTPRTIHFAPQGCNCPMTQQFNPVCGTDGNTYKNMGLLNCYARCGTNVSQKRLGTC